MIGRTLSHYKVLEKIGEGGMGEVYLANDTKLDREVAVKVLPSTLSQDKDRLARFEREARLLASLNHPNIAAIHELEESDGVHFLALEYVPGETLAERIKRGPIPIDEAVPLFKQIAEGLEAAHEKGVIHRDLKPANIKVTPEGNVKVLDFGLAKAFSEETASPDLSESPTMTRNDTAAGFLLGTAPYMSPEQARGKRVDKRADVWAFGCCLFEALTGKKAYEGDTVSDAISSILRGEPDWDRLPEGTPPSLHRLLRRCLKKDLHWRVPDVAMARIELEEAVHEPAPESLASFGPARRRLIVPLFLSAMVAALVTGLGVWTALRQPGSPSVVRAVFPLPPGQEMREGFPPMALSPDGTRLVYAAKQGPSTQLYLRSLDEAEAKPIPGTEGASHPFFSPDGRWIGFCTKSYIQKVSVAGGAPLRICETPLGVNASWGWQGASWGPDNSIIFGAAAFGLYQVSADGGTPECLLYPDNEQGESRYDWPHILPSGNDVLFTIPTKDDSRIAVLSLETGEYRILLRGSTAVSQPRYLRTGHLVYADAGRLLVQPFDLRRLEVSGSAVPVVENVLTVVAYATSAYFTASENGLLAYVPGEVAAEAVLVWVDQNGRARPMSEDRGVFSNPRLSPDGKQVAFTVATRGSQDIWISDFDRGTRTRLTFGPLDTEPVWTPDGKKITFSSFRSGALLILWKSADGTDEPQALVSLRYAAAPSSWSPDGKVLAFYEVNPNTRRDIWTVSLDGDRTPAPFLVTEFDEHSPMFSPDGRWLAFVSNESGREEIYVQPYPGPGKKNLISTDGGREPVWSSDGGRLSYRSGDKMMSVAIRTEPELVVGAPRVVFQGSYVSYAGGGNSYDMSRDGQRFLMVRSEQQTTPEQINVILNWFEELKRLVPTN